MQYFILPLMLILYFELLGRWIAYKFGLKLHSLFFPLGFFSLMGVIYPSLLLSINNVSFKLLCIIYMLVFLATAVLIIRDFKHLSKKTNKYYLLFIIICSILLMYYSLNTSLGNLHGFDTVAYLNFVTNNINSASLNSKDIYLNGARELSLTYYNGQVFYYFAGIVVSLFGKIASLFKIEYFYSTSYIWTFQTIFHVSLLSAICEGISKAKNKFTVVFPVAVMIMFFGRVYFNSVYGFFGNSLLTICIAYVSYFAIEYFDNQSKNSRQMIYLLLAGGCSLSSSGIYILAFFLIGFFFFVYDIDETMKEYALVVFFPLLNAINMERYPVLIVYGIPISLSLFLFFFGDKCTKQIKKHNLIKPLLIICFLVTLGLSRIYSSGLFDFSGLLDNLSQRYDMTLNYFYFKNDILNVALYKIFVISVCLLVSLTNYKKPYVMLSLILVITLFNPFSCNVINHFINVYYRAYMIIINPFTLIYFYGLIEEKIDNKFLVNSLSCLMAIAFVLCSNPSNPIYYHYQHKPEKNYDRIYKMTNDEIDIIRELKNEIDYYGEEEPYIITGNLLTQSMLPKGKYIYGRTYYVSPKWSDAEKNLYGIFYTPEYLGDYLVENPDYDNMYKYLKDAGINYLVVDKRVEYHDKKESNYYSLMYKVNNECNLYPAYENETYVLYHFEN